MWVLQRILPVFACIDNAYLTASASGLWLGRDRAPGSADASVARVGVSTDEGDVSTNPICLTDTGVSCAGDGSCGQYVPCNAGGRCVCPKTACADSLGNCRSVWSRWQDIDIRFGSALMPGKGFISMPSKQGPPVIRIGYPSDRDTDGVWLMLLQNDNVSVLLTTKESRFSADGLFLSLPPGPLDDDIFIQPVQSKPTDAKQAAWVIEPSPSRTRHRLRHVASDRYLMVIENKMKGVHKDHAVPQKLPEPIVSTCTAKTCLPGSADLDIWPKSEVPEVFPKFTLAAAPWERTRPWILEKAEGGPMEKAEGETMEKAEGGTKALAKSKAVPLASLSGFVLMLIQHAAF